MMLLFGSCCFMEAMMFKWSWPLRGWLLLKTIVLTTWWVACRPVLLTVLLIQVVSWYSVRGDGVLQVLLFGWFFFWDMLSPINMERKVGGWGLSTPSMLMLFLVLKRLLQVIGSMWDLLVWVGRTICLTHPWGGCCFRLGLCLLGRWPVGLVCWL